MTQAVCFKCGEIKWGAFNHCDKCGARPRSDDELMLSLAFTDHYFDLEKLQRIGRDIEMGNPPHLDEATKSKLSPAVQEAKMMLGIDRTAKQQASSKRWRLFYSPGLIWPFFAAVASLIMMWTILAVNLRLVPSRDSPILFGLLFGVRFRRCRRARVRHIIAPRRSNSAHLHRSWRATVRFCTVQFDFAAVRAQSRECRRILATHQGASEQILGFLDATARRSRIGPPNPNTGSKNDSA